MLRLRFTESLGPGCSSRHMSPVLHSNYVIEACAWNIKLSFQ